MKQFISTEFFLTLQETSQTGIIENADVLKNKYDKFADEVPEDEAKEMAIKLLPECKSVFANYPL